MLQREHSAILSTFIKLPVVIKIFVLSLFVAVLHRVYFIDFFVLALIIQKPDTNVYIVSCFETSVEPDQTFMRGSNSAQCKTACRRYMYIPLH